MNPVEDFGADEDDEVHLEPDTEAATDRRASPTELSVVRLAATAGVVALALAVSLDKPWGRSPAARTRAPTTRRRPGSSRRGTATAEVPSPR